MKVALSGTENSTLTLYAAFWIPSGELSEPNFWEDQVKR